MSLLNSLTDELKAAMRAKDSLKLEALRAIKSAVLWPKLQLQEMLISPKRKKSNYFKNW